MHGKAGRICSKKRWIGNLGEAKLSTHLAVEDRGQKVRPRRAPPVWGGKVPPPSVCKSGKMNTFSIQNGVPWRLQFIFTHKTVPINATSRFDVSLTCLS